MMKNRRRWWIAAAAAVALAVTVGTGAVVMAQTPVPGVSGAGSSFLERVAAKLGIDAGTLRNAVKTTADEDIDARVQSGELTQAQADQLRQQVESAPDDAFVGPGFGRHGRGMGTGMGVDDQALAGFLGMTADQLRTELQASGATLASVAEAHGKSRDALKSFLTDQFKARLDQEVADGRHTQAEADARLAQFTANLDQFIDGSMPLGGRGFGGPFGQPPAAPSTTPGSSGSSSLTPGGGV